MKFVDRKDAGQQLAKKLMSYKDSDAIVIGLSRGGLVVAQEVASILDLPLDVKVAQKISAPSNEDLAVGALTASGTIYLNEPLLKQLGVSMQMLAPSIDAAQKEANRRLTLYRGDREPLELKDKVVIIVDEGIAVNDKILAAIKSVKLKGAKKIIVAVPVASQEKLSELAGKVDEIVCLEKPEQFIAISLLYTDFPRVTDEQVTEIMQ